MRKFYSALLRSCKKTALTSLVFLFCLIKADVGFSQIQLIPASDGGFENATSTFLANGWTVVNSTTNLWQIGTATKNLGAKSAYISNDGGTTNAYSNNARASHFYRDIAIPAGAVNITLSFAWKGRGEVGFDRLLVYTAPTSVTPVANAPTAGNTAITGATLVFTQTVFQAAYTTATITLPNALAGTTVRLIFTWQNDGSAQTAPPASVDDVSLTYSQTYIDQFSALTNAASPWCAGETRNVSVTVKNNGTATWISNAATGVNFSYWWSNQSGRDANPRILPFISLAPNASQVVTIPITSPATAGTYVLNFDLVKEGSCWFADNVTNCSGPGNSVFTSSITVAAIPAAPTATTPQPFCTITTPNPTIANLTTTTGTTIKWYAASTGGTALITSTPLVNGTTYYASQTNASGCESSGRVAVAVTVGDPAAPTSAGPQSFCAINNPTVANLTATGTTIKWYTASTGGTALVTTTPLATGTYYASQTVSGCESATRLSVTVTVDNPAAPTGSGPQSFCAINSPTVANLVATGSAIQWYLVPTGGTALATTTPLITGTHYYASQTVSGCEGISRLDVTATIANPAAPTGTATQTFCSSLNPTVADLTATGSIIQWYSAATGGTTLTNTTSLVSGTHYYASQIVSSCESVTRLDVTAVVNTAVSITTNPSPATQTVCATSNVTYTVVAGGNGLTYQWYKDGVQINNGGNKSGATTASLLITGVALSDDGDYTVVVSGLAPCVFSTSTPVHLDVDQRATFTAQPVTPQTICQGNLYTISATANGTVVTAIWNHNGIFYGTASVSGNVYSLTIPVVALADAGNYQLVLDDGMGGCSASNSNIAVLNVSPTSVGGTVGADATVCYGTNSGTLTLSGYTGSIISWESSTDNFVSVINPITNTTTSQTYTNLTQTTRYRAVVQNGVCPSDNSSFATITVNPDLIAGTVSSDQTICYNTTPAAFTNVTSPAGGTGSYTYQWQSASALAGPYNNIASATATTYAPGVLTVTTYYRRNETSGTCGTVSANVITVTVNPNLVAGTVAASQTICYNTTPAAFASSTLPAGGTSSYTYQWQSSPDNIAFTDISGATATTYSPNALIATTYYRRNETSGTCGTVSSNVITVNVRANLVAGTVAASQTICYNTAPAPFTSSGLPSGGTGTYTYQWQSSPDNITFTNIPAATATTYTSGVLTATTYFRRNETSGTCGTVSSNVLTVTVNPNLVAGTVGTNQTICYNTTPAAFTSTTLPTGGTGSYTYQWQSASALAGPYNNIPTATATTYAPGALTATTYYRRNETSGTCGTVSSNVITITVYNVLTGGTVATTPQTICYNTAPTAFTSTVLPTGADGIYTYQWQSSPDNVTFTNISGATATTYTSGALTATTYFKRNATSTTCGTTASSNVITVNVRANLVAGTVAASQTICYNTAPAPFTSSGLPSGGTGTYTYQWQSSPDNITFTNIPAATATTYTSGVLTATTYFRRNETSGTCGTVSSNVLTVTVNPNLVAGTVGTNQTICYNTTPAAFTSTTLPTGGTGSYTYQWQSASALAGPYNNIPTATATTYAPGALTATTYYRRNETSGTCGTVSSNVITITVYNVLTGGTVATTPQTICYNTAPTAFTSTVLPTGADGIYTYQWQSSPDNVTFTNISGATATTYTSGALTATTYFKRNATSTTCGTTASSNVITVNVRANLVAGTVAASQTICYNTAPAPFTSSGLPSGGTGTYTYQWQSSPDNITFTNIPAATATTYTSGVLTATTYFRRNETSGTCGTVSSNVLTVTVNPNLVAGTVGTNQTICYNTTPAAFTSTTLPTGGTGSYTYQWQSASALAGPYNNIPTATATTYAPGALTATTYYRRNETSGTCGTVSSNVITITVYNVLTGGTVATTPQTICYNTAPTAFTSTVLPTGADGIYTYQWQSSPDNVTFTNISGATATTYTSGALTATTYFKRNATSTTCGTTASSNVITVNVRANLVAGTVAASQTICYNTAPAPFTSSGLPSGGTGTYTYQWQSSPDNITFTNIPAATATTYTSGVLTATTYFRRNETSGTCGTVSSNVLTVTVNPLPVVSITGPNPICAGFTTTLSPSTGGTWVSNNTLVATVDMNTGVVTGVATVTGTATFTFTQTSTGCVNTTSSLTVNALPVVAPITDGATSICINGITNFNDATAGGTWSITPGTGTASIDNTGLVTGLSAGTVTVVYTFSNGTCTNSVSALLTIDALPAISPIVGGATSVCENAVTPAFTDATSGGTWSVINGTGSASITPGGVVTGITAGTATVLYTTNNGTCSNEAAKPLTVKPAPVVAAMGGGATSVCVTQSTPAFTDATSGGTWSIINGTGTASITSGGVVTGLTAGSVTVVYTFNNGTCTNTATKPLTINGQTTLQPIGGGASVVCINSATPAFTNSTAGGIWSINNGSGSATITTSGIVTGTGAGTVTVVYTYNNGSCTDFVTAPLTVNPLPVAGAITGASGVCVGSTVPLTSNATGAATLTYTWASSSSAATVTNAGAVTGVASGTSNITYTVTDGNGCSSISPSYTISINARPIANITGPNTALCNGGSTNITGTVTASGAWTLTLSNGGATATGTGNGTFSISVSPSATTTYTITSLTDANCSSVAGDLTGSVTITINNPVVIGTQPSDVSVCATLPADLTVSATGSSPTYQWYKGTAPSGIPVSNSANITGATTNNLHFNSASTSDDADYYVIVTGISPCAPQTSATVHLTVSTTITISTPPMSQAVCIGSDATFSVSASTAVGPLAYQWRKNGTNIPGAILSSYTIVGTTAADAGNYDVVITGIGGCTTAFSAVAALTIDPASVGGTVSASAAECSGNNSATLNLTGQTGVVVNWESSPDGTTWTTVAPANTTTSLTYTNLTSLTYYRAVVKSGVCLPANSSAAIITIKPIPNATATPASQSKCSGNAITTIVLGSAVSGTTFAWTRDNNASVTGILATGSGDISGTLVNATTAPVTVTFTITPSANGCVGTPITATVIVSPAPNAVATPASQTVCSGPITAIAVSGNIPSTIYNWTRNNTASVTGIPASGSGNISGSLVNSTNASVTVTFTITPTVGGCPGTPITATVSVKPIPAVFATNASQPPICSGTGITTINISSSSGIPGTTFSWLRDNTTNITGLASGSGTPISGTLTNTTNTQQVTIFTITATANGCSSSTPATITVNPKPTMTSANALQICNKSAVGLSLTSTVPSNYTWIAANNANTTGESTTSQAAAVISDVLINTSGALPYNSGSNTPGLTPRQAVVYQVVPTSSTGGCTGPTQTVTITVNPVYNATWITPDDVNTLTICDGEEVGPSQNDIDLLTGDYRGSTLLWQYSVGSPGPWSPMVGPYPNNEKSDTFPAPPSVLSPIGTYYFRLLIDACASDTLVLTKTSTLAIDAGPDNTVCESGSPAAITLSGSSLTGTSTTTKGGTWTITSINPSNGGNNGTLTPGFLTPAQIPTATYTPPANYSGTVILTLTSNDPDGPPGFFNSNPCVGITDTRVITITQAPIISNASMMAICSGTGTNINLTSVIPSTFTWSVGGITGGITGATPASGSGTVINQVLTNPSTSVTGTVQYNVTPTPNLPYSGCAAVVSSITVNVTPSPAVALTTSAATVCQGATPTLTATNSGGTLSRTLSGTSGTLNFAIPDDNTTGSSSIVNLAGSGGLTLLATDVIKVTLNISHTYDDDLDIFLVDPSGTRAMLLSSDNGGNDNDYTNTILKTDVANIIGSTGNNAGPFNGTYRPEGTITTAPGTYLSIPNTPLLGAPVDGNWTLRVFDDGPQDIGTLINWSLTITRTAPYTSVFTGPATIGPVTYSGANNTTATATVTPPVGTNNYTATTTDAAGCVGTSAPVAVVVNPTLTLTSATTSAVCAGSPATINLSGLVANSTSVITYKIGSGSNQTVTVTATGTTGTFNTGNLTFANNGQTLLISAIAYSTAPFCSQSPNVSVSLIVNPAPTLSGATQAPVCDGSSAQINLTGLVANSTFTVTYTIGGGPVQTVTGVVAAGTNASFNTIPLTFANNGQNLRITGITITSAAPNCPQLFALDIPLAVKVIPVLSSTLTPPPVCSGSTFTYAPTSATTGATFTWTRAAVTGITPATSNGTGNVMEVLTNTTSAPISVIYKYITTANGCNNSPGENVVVSVNPSPAIATASQAGASCSGSGATINLTGLIPGTTSTIYYVINNVAQTPVTGVVSGAGGTASFVSANLTLANDGQILKITGISNTLFAPACIKSVNVITLLSVTPVPTLAGASQAAAICVSGPATVNLTGLVVTSVNNTINYSINSVAQPAVTGVDADALGNATFNTSILTSANNGQTLTITGITSGACLQSFSQSFVLNVGVSYVWKGVNNDWFDIQNWCGGIPAITSDVLIPGSLTNYPILTTGTAYTHNITIQSTASVTLTGATLQIAGLITNNGTFDVSNGAIEFNGTSGGQTIPANAFTGNKIKDLIISNNVSLGGQDSVTSSLNFGSVMNKAFATNGNLTLKSTAANTAAVGPITGGNSITGDVWVERYISAKRAWRFLSVPTNTTQTFHQAWQEGMGQGTTTQTNPAGYGTQITNKVTPTPANGFDYYSGDGPSVKKYDLTATGPYAPYASINTTFDVMATKEGLFTFVRGDRRSAGLGAPSYPTVLRTKGPLYTGDQTYTVTPGTFKSIGNPYAAPLDMRQVDVTGTREFFYVWDPNSTSTLGFGNFQTFVLGAGGNYYPTPGGGSYPSASTPFNYIQSGAAFFVAGDPNATSNKTVTVSESSKAASATAGNVLVFRPSAIEEVTAQLRTNLYAIETSGSASLVDGTLNQFADRFSNDIDRFDAVKLTNLAENLAIKTNNQLLVVERRQNIVKEDTIHLNMFKMKAKSYRFEILSQNFDPALTAFLEDSYFNTRTAINLSGTTMFDFNVVDIPGSWNPSRFTIVFASTLGGPLPVTFTTVKAYQKNKDVAVEWRVEGEKNIKQYEVEKSTDGQRFNTAATELATGNNGSSVNYQWLDVNAITGNNYYRVRSVDIDGKVKYSQIVKVVLGTIASRIMVYPNPVTDGYINLQLMNQPQGRYGIRLMNKLGQVIMIKEIEHQEGSSTENLKVKLLSHGSYNLEVTRPDKGVTNINVLY